MLFPQWGLEVRVISSSMFMHGQRFNIGIDTSFPTEMVLKYTSLNSVVN